MDPMTIAAIGSAASQAGSGIFGYLGQKSVNKTNIRLAKEARDYDLQKWHLQNEYNTPAAQMQRYKEAGLNPNLIYGNGSSSAGNADSVPKAPVPQVDNALAYLSQAMNVAPILSQYQDWQVKKAQIDKIEAERKAIDTNRVLTALKSTTQDLLNKKYEIKQPWINVHEENKASLDRQRSDNILSSTLLNEQRYSAMQKQYPAIIKQIMLRNELIEQQARQAKINADLDQSLKPFGVTSSDALWQRILGITLSPFLNRAKKYILNYQNKF